MKFIDEATIEISSGDGGPGAVSFRREPYVPKGGPDGGDGGSGGGVYVVGTRDLSTLLDFRYRRFYKAPSGKRGGGANKTGADGEEIVIRLPLGTIVTDTDRDAVIADIVTEGERTLIAAGGRGGKGNAHFASSTNRAPRTAQSGLPGVTIPLRLTLKLIADIGLVGFPNAGKSTLLARTTRARPKIADYPFTTLTPNLGVVSGYGRDFVIADIPGIIEGASEGAGLGLTFLRHIERAKLFLFLIDASDTERTPLAAYTTLADELEAYRPGILDDHPSIVALNKLDAVGYLDAPTRKKVMRNIGSLRKRLAAGSVELAEISALTGDHVNELLGALAGMVANAAAGGNAP